jgi:hypothetical protein
MQIAKEKVVELVRHDSHFAMRNRARLTPRPPDISGMETRVPVSVDFLRAVHPDLCGHTHDQFGRAVFAAEKDYVVIITRWRLTTQQEYEPVWWRPWMRVEPGWPSPSPVFGPIDEQHAGEFA